LPDNSKQFILDYIIHGVYLEVIMRVVTFSEAKKNLKIVLDHVVDDADYAVITRQDAEDAVILSLDYFNSLLETVHLLNSPANAAHLGRSIEQYRSGQVAELELVDE
jgi:antitoxin YefM